MADTKTVALSQTYVSGTTSFSSVVFRAPELNDYRVVGRVMERQGATVVTYEDRVWTYVDRLLQDLNPGALAKIELTDALAIEEAILDFFGEARRQLNARQSSSSASVGAGETSTT